MQGVRNALCNPEGWLLYPGTGLRRCWTPHSGQATFYIWLIVSPRDDSGTTLLCLSLLSILVISLTVCVYPHLWVYKTQYLNDRVFNSSSTEIGLRTRTKMSKLQIWVWRTASQLQREPREAWWVVTKSTTNTNNNSKTTSTTTTTLSQGTAASLRQRTKFKYFYCA